MAPENPNRRRFLTISTCVIGGAGAAALAVPFIGAWNPSAKAKADGAAVSVNVSKLEPGQMIRVEWRKQPVWVVRRTQAVIDTLNQHDSQLRDPESIQGQQPVYAQNPLRSLNPEFFVAVGICTHLGCSPTYLPDSFQEQVSGVQAGFFCPCHGSKFDMAGRVFQGVPAPLNLMVPPYHFADEQTLVVGEDPKEALT
ncbi:ubiquinol-cytochrome c reductase iron-sulfur subunit [Vibrio stylophorae]|nr:ubiquinol-cytochrome c reductase iron-sulfur subunit [Vibrio stylophorae]